MDVSQNLNPQLFHDGGRYHVETICGANQWSKSMD